jgi:hypothetical protein
MSAYKFAHRWREAHHKNQNQPIHPKSFPTGRKRREYEVILNRLQEAQRTLAKVNQTERDTPRRRKNLKAFDENDDLNFD